jgi:hypothetical protein
LQPGVGLVSHDIMHLSVSRRRFTAWCLGGGLLLASTTAAAQTSSLLLPPATASSDNYDRGHNVSVAERPHPEYDALGLRFGSFIVNPQLTTSLSYSSNVFNDNLNKKADVYAGFEPYVSVASDWSVHQLRMVAAGDIRRFANQSLRNQNAWYVQGGGRVDISTGLNVTIEAQADRTYESPFSLDVVANLTVPSRYLHSGINARILHEIGQSRLIATASRDTYDFGDIQFADGSVRNQRYRDRTSNAGTVTYELAFSPSLSLYGRAEIDRNSYKALAFGQPNRDSYGYRAIAGTNFDIAGVARGTIGVGYSYRTFDAKNIYKNTSGLSLEARGDWFADELTTVGVFLQRRLIDVDLANVGSSWDNSARVTIDHELLYNMIVTVGGEVSKRTYSQLSSSTNVYRVEVSSRYQVNRWLGLSADVGYGSTQPQGSGLGNAFNELRGRLSLRIRR